MATIPVIPSFPAGTVVTSAALTQAAAAARWLCYTRPLTQAQQQVTQSIPNSAATPVTWDTKITDRDSGLTSATTYTAQTPGYYLLAASVCYAANSTGGRQCYFTVTTGPGNPAGPGITTSFALAAIPGAATVPAAAVSKSLVPQRVYAGDSFQVIAFQSSGGALPTSTANGGSYWTIQMVSA
jgi:hypothetical protein